MNIGRAIKTYRESINITQNDMSKWTGISQTSLSIIETGKRIPHPSTIKKIANCMNVCPAYLYIIAIEETDVPPSNVSDYHKKWPKVVKTASNLFTK